MKKKRITYNSFQKVSAVFMILALAWLTVSTAFIYAAKKQEAAKQGKIAGAQLPGADDNQEEESKPMPNSTEEKNPTASSLSEEYLHDNHADEHLFSVVLQYHIHENATTYIAFHGELHAPPPNLA